MKTYVIKVSVVITLFLFGMNTKTYSQTTLEEGEFNTKIDSDQRLSQTVSIVKKDSLILSETKDTLPMEKKMVDIVVKRPYRCMNRIETIPVSIYLLDPCSTIIRYRSKDILRYRY